MLWARTSVGITATLAISHIRDFMGNLFELLGISNRVLSHTTP